MSPRSWDCCDTVKGLTHFVTGVTWASCFPVAVQAAADGNPLYFLLGGVAGLLPDTLDFKLARYMFRHDVEIIPDPSRPDPQLIATAFARLIHDVRATGKPVSVKLNTARVGAGLWGQYRVTFDETRHAVTVAYTGVVTTGRARIRTDAARETSFSAPLACSVAADYQATTEVDIFDGPTFTMAPLPGGRVGVFFIPWHRQWSHSILFAAALGGLAAWFWGWPAAAVAAGGCGLHIAADQLGFMGTNLFFPFTRRRQTGRRMVHSDNTLANFAVVWVSVLVIYWNLARLAPRPHFAPHLIPLLFYAAFVPLMALKFLGRFLRPSRTT